MSLEEPLCLVTALGVWRLYRVTVQWEWSWENRTTEIPAVDSGICPRQREPLQPSACITFAFFPREHEFNCLFPVSSHTRETSSGFTNSILFSLTERPVSDQIKLRFNFALIMRDTDHVKGTSYIIPPCAQMWLYPVPSAFLSFNWVLTWVLNAI